MPDVLLDEPVRDPTGTGNEFVLPRTAMLQVVANMVEMDVTVRTVNITTILQSPSSLFCH